MTITTKQDEPDDYVAWCRYIYNDGGGIQSIVTCDSDAKGAFKVYRQPDAVSIPTEPEVSKARLQNQAENIIYEVFGAINLAYKQERPLIRQLIELRDLITRALLVAYQSTAPSEPEVLCPQCFTDNLVDGICVAEGCFGRTFPAPSVSTEIADRMMAEFQAYWDRHGELKTRASGHPVTEIERRMAAIYNDRFCSVSTADSPILAFEEWAIRWCADNGRKLTQTEYGIAQTAFYAAHPGEVPISHTMTTAELEAELQTAQTLYEQTTRGEWQRDIHNLSQVVVLRQREQISVRDTLVVQDLYASQNDLKWIAAAHNLWPRLIELLRQLSQNWCDHCSADLDVDKKLHHLLCENCYRWWLD